MKYALAIAVFWAGFLPPFAAGAQFRAAPAPFSGAPARIGRNFVAVPRTTPQRVSPPIVVPRAPMTPRLKPFRNRWRGFGWRGFPRRNFVVIQPFSFPYYSYYPPFYLFQWLPLDVEYEQARRIANGDQAVAASAQEQSAVAGQLQALTDQVEFLNQQTSSKAQSYAGAATASQERSAPAVFVLRNGSRIEARNYAIMGETLWIFSGEASRRIPLSTLNLPLTRRLNEGRGIDLTLPNSQ